MTPTAPSPTTTRRSSSIQKTPRGRERSGARTSSKTAFPMSSHKDGDWRSPRPGERSYLMLNGRRRFGCCHVNGWLYPLDYRCSPLLRRYQQGTPRAGYRGSDFVPWHQADHPRRSENIVGFLMDSRSAGAAPGLSAAGVINLRRPIGDSQKNEKIVTVTQMTRALKSTAI